MQKMRVSPKFVVLFAVTVILICYFLNFTKKHQNLHDENAKESVAIAVVVCGIDHIAESLVMIKSAVLLNPKTTNLNFIIVTEDALRENFKEKLENFQNFGRFSYEIYSIKFPDRDGDQWRKLFKPCASQRLFLPSLLPHIEALLYVDSDVIFLAPPSAIFDHFKAFNQSQLAGMTSESENSLTGWYTRFARHPFYQPFGLNSGVMLMNLTRMRSVHFEAEIEPIYQKYKNKIAWGDQDLLNIYFHEHPQQLFLMRCEFNYRPDHCMYTSQCDASEGVKVLHGNRGYFHKDGKQIIFKEVFMAFDEYQSPTDPCSHIVKAIESQVKISDTSNCNELINNFLYIPKRHFCENYNENY